MKRGFYVRITAYELPESGLTPDLCRMARKSKALYILEGWLQTDAIVGAELRLEGYIENGLFLSAMLKSGPIILVVGNFAFTKRWVCQVLKVPPQTKHSSQKTA